MWWAESFDPGYKRFVWWAAAFLATEVLFGAEALLATEVSFGGLKLSILATEVLVGLKLSWLQKLCLVYRHGLMQAGGCAGFSCMGRSSFIEVQQRGEMQLSLARAS